MRYRTGIVRGRCGTINSRRDRTTTAASRPREGLGCGTLPRRTERGVPPVQQAQDDDYWIGSSRDDDEGSRARRFRDGTQLYYDRRPAPLCCCCCGRWCDPASSRRLGSNTTF